MNYRALLLIGLLSPTYAAAQTAQEEEDQGFLTDLIEENLSGVSREVNIVGFEGALSSEASIARLTIADEEGIWLTLEDVVLDWNRSALLRGRIEVAELSAALVEVSRAPISDGGDAPSPEAQPFALPDLPVSIELETLDIDRIVLGESFLDEEVTISLSGSASLAGGEGAANVTATRLDETDGTFEINGSYSNETEELVLALTVDEEADGIAARLLDLPGRPSLLLSVQGEGPISTFGANITLATDGQDRVTGTFARLQDDNGLQGFRLDVGGDVTPLFEPDYRDFFGTDVALIAEGRELANGRFDLSELDISARRLRLTGDAVIGAEGWPERIDLVGTIDDPTGEVVLLPLAGPKTYVDGVDLNIAYNQSISDAWTADFTIEGFDRPGLFIEALELTGGGTIVPGEGTEIGEVTVDLEYAATGLELDDPGSAEAFGDRVTGSIQANSVEGQPIEVSQITLRGPGIEADASATIDTTGETDSIRSTVALNVEALGRFSTLAGRDLAGAANVVIESVISPLDGLFDIAVTGGTDDLAVGIAQVDPLLAGVGEIDIAFVRDTEGTRLETLDITTPEVTITADADITSAGSEARFDARIAEISVVEPSLTGPVTLTGTLDQAASGLLTFDVAGRGPDAQITADGTARPTDPGYTVTANVTADARDLSTFSAIADRSLAGAITAELSGTLRTEGLLFDGDLSARTTDLSVDIAELDPLLTGTGTIAVDLQRHGPTQYRARDLQVRLPDVRLDADADVDTDGPLDATFDLQLTDVGLIADDVSGPLGVTGTATRGTDGVALIDVAASAPGATADIDVSVAPETNAISGTVTAAIEDLGAYADLIGQPIDGGLSARVEGDLVPDLSSFDLQIAARTQDLETGITQADPLLAGPGSLAATARQSAAGIDVPNLTLTTPQVSLDAVLNATADGLGSGTYTARINDIGLIADGLSGAATAEGTARQDADGAWSVQSDLTAPGATATADLIIAAETNEISGTVQAAVNELGAYRDVIGQPVSGGVTANVSGSVLPDLSRFDADIAVETRDLGIGNTTADLLLRGLGNLDLEASRTADGIAVRDLNLRTNNVTLTGTLDTTNSGSSQGQFDAQLRDVGILTDQLSGPVTASGTASVSEDGTIGIDASGTGPGGITVQADGQVLSGGTLDLDVSGALPLGLANAALAPRRIDGTANFDLSVNGPAAMSSVSGDISVGGARITAPTLGQAINEIAGNVRLSDSRVQVDMSGRVQNGGRVTITGPIGLTGGLQSDMEIALRNVVLRDPELYETSVDGTIAVTGPLTGGARIVGRLELGQTDIQVPSSGVGSLGDLPDVVHVGENGAVARTLERAGVNGETDANGSSTGGGSAAFPLDIVVDAPSRIFIRGRGLDAELGGSLSLSGTTANIIPVGQFSLIRGRIDILQQRFDLTEGVATLQGDFSPYIRLVAETEAATGTVVRIIVEGPADAPEVTFESVPELPQDEVLAQLIFGRDISEISPLQAVQLAAAVGTLAGSGGGGLINDFREGLGLDDFDVTTDEDGNAAVRAGAYLSENVYTDVTINAEGETEINLNLDITDEITAKGTVDQDGETSLGVFFERDY